jgi:hypothetical protein
MFAQEQGHGVALLRNAEVGNLEGVKNLLLLVAADQVKDEVGLAHTSDLLIQLQQRVDSVLRAMYSMDLQAQSTFRLSFCE